MDRMNELVLENAGLLEQVDTLRRMLSAKTEEAQTLQWKLDEANEWLTLNDERQDARMEQLRQMAKERDDAKNALVETLGSWTDNLTFNE